MATGRGVQQISETSTVLPLLQQQELPTLSPIEQRHVAEHQSAAAAFAEAPAADEPMAIEVGLAAEEIPLEDLIANFLPRHREQIRQRLNDEDIQQVLNAVRSFLKMLKDNGIKLTPGRGQDTDPLTFWSAMEDFRHQRY